MTNIQETLKAAIEAMDWEIGGEPLPTLMLKAREDCKAALSELEKCEPVGITGEMPASNGGFSMCVFNSKDVPVGTKLYTSPQPNEWVDIDLSEYERQGLGAIANEINEKIKRLNTKG